MNSTQLLLEAIEIIGDATPLKFNCGTLCDRACCVCDGHMMVFPGERKLLENQAYFFARANLKSYGDIDIVTCDGTCNRDYRPFSCRIYPLAPKVVNDKIFVRLDVRGRPTCPLCHKQISALNIDFVEKVKKSLLHISKDDDIKKFLYALSKSIDMFAVPFF